MFDIIFQELGQTVILPKTGNVHCVAMTTTATGKFATDVRHHDLSVRLMEVRLILTKQGSRLSDLYLML